MTFGLKCYAIEVSQENGIFPSIGSLFKFKPKWICLLHATSTNSVVRQQSLILSIAQYSSIIIYLLPMFNEEMTRLAKSLVAFDILDSPHSLSMAKSTFRFGSEILDIIQLFHMIWGFISLHTWEHHIIACLHIRHYIPQVLTNSRRIKMSENPFQKLILRLNYEWSNHSLIHGLYHTCNIKW